MYESLEAHNLLFQVLNNDSDVSTTLLFSLILYVDEIQLKNAYFHYDISIFLYSLYKMIFYRKTNNFFAHSLHQMNPMFQFHWWLLYLKISLVCFSSIILKFIYNALTFKKFNYAKIIAGNKSKLYKISTYLCLS